MYELFTFLHTRFPPHTQSWTNVPGRKTLTLSTEPKGETITTIPQQFITGSTEFSGQAQHWQEPIKD